MEIYSSRHMTELTRAIVALCSESHKIGWFLPRSYTIGQLFSATHCATNSAELYIHILMYIVVAIVMVDRLVYVHFYFTFPTIE